MLRLFSCLACLICFAAVPSAYADTFTYSYSGSGLSGYGVVTGTADPYQANAYDVTSVTMNLNGSDFPVLVTSPTDTAHPGSTDGFTFDDVLYTSGAAALDQNGILLSFGGGTLFADLSYNNGYQIAVREAGDPIDTAIYPLASFQATRVAPTPTPEPTTLIFLGTGALMLGALIRRRPAF